MWKQTSLFVGRYLAIGILIGSGIFVADEVHWRYFGSQRMAEIEQGLDRVMDSYQMLQFEPIARSLEKGQPETTQPATGERFNLFRPTPFFVNGELTGYRVYPGSNREAFRSLGLRPGDLVTKIDGQPLDDAAVSFELLRKVAGGQPAVLTILRGDKLEEIEIKVN